MTNPDDDANTYFLLFGITKNENFENKKGDQKFKGDPNDENATMLSHPSTQVQISR
jgi:hypothetical protein